MLPSQTVFPLLQRYIQLKKTGSCNQAAILKTHWIDFSDSASGFV